MTDSIALYSLGLGILGLVAVFLTFTSLKRQPSGTDAMRALSHEIHVGALAFLKREYTVVLPFLVIVSGILAWGIGVKTGIAYAFGGLCSIASGWIGMQGATAANVRTTEGARSGDQAQALRMAFSGGSVMGLAVAALGLAGIAVVFMFLGSDRGVERRPRSSPKSSPASRWARRRSRSSPGWAAASTPRRPTSAPTSWARSKPAFPRTIPGIPRPSPTTSVTTSATWPASAPTSSRATSAR